MANEKVNLAALKSVATLMREPSEHAQEPRTRFTVDLPDSDHQALKLLAVESRMSMSDLIRGAVKLMREQEDVTALVRRRARSL